MRLFRLCCICALLAACGYKGDLYLPKAGDKARFGAVQTGLSLQAIPPQSLPSHD